MQVLTKHNAMAHGNKTDRITIGSTFLDSVFIYCINTVFFKVYPFHIKHITFLNRSNISTNKPNHKLSRMP